MVIHVARLLLPQWQSDWNSGFFGPIALRLVFTIGMKSYAEHQRVCRACRNGYGAFRLLRGPDSALSRQQRFDTQFARCRQRSVAASGLCGALGRVSGTITNPERGHGEFSFSLGNERYVGEATRESGSSSGHANASSDRGGYVKCSYTMNSASLGAGTCNFSGGARYDMHISL